MAQNLASRQAPLEIDFERVFDSATTVLVLVRTDPEFTVAAVNRRCLDTMEKRRDELVGHSFFEVFTNALADAGAALSAGKAAFERVLATKQRDWAPVHFFKGRYWQPMSAPVLADDGSVLYILHRLDDATDLALISQKEQAERAELAQTNARFQAIFDQALYAGRLDLHGKVIDANRSSLETCGYRREDVVGKAFWDCGWWNRSAQVRGWVKHAVAEATAGRPFRGESTYWWADGTERIMEFACMPIRDEAGSIVFLFTTGLDITDRVASEKDLRATSILESITEGFFALDRQWRFTYVNRAAAKIIGQDRHDMLGKVVWEACPSLISGAVESGYRATMTEGTPFTTVNYYPEYDEWFEVRAYPAADGVSVYFRCVSEQKRIERERERLATESENQRRIYDAALSNTPDLVYIFDLDHRFTYANEALLRMWGRLREDAIGKTCLELGYEPWHAEMHDREIERVVKTKQPIRGEVAFTGTNGRRIYDYIFAPVVGSTGSVVAIAATARDITEAKLTEQAIREQAEQLKALHRTKDEFLATLSHELRNPLAPLRNSLALLRMTAPRDSAAAPIHEMMERQVNHLVRLVDDLLETSRLTRGTLELRKERVRVCDVVRNALETSAPAIEAAGHALAVSLASEALWVEGDPVRLAQILGNLLDNAVKYMDDGGRINLTVRRDGDHVAISVRDDGVGIPPEELGRMFEMFSRGERVGRRGNDGLGIGLALARRLAEMHSGTLEAHSDGIGRGSEFTLRLPLAAGDGADPYAQTGAHAELPHKRILVVDDNRDAADSLGIILELMGADVRVARGGREAIDAFAHYDPAVVLLDIGMPDMDGYEVARTLRTRYPQHPASIIALTGWGQESDRIRAREAGFDHHLIKPAEIGALQALLDSLPR